MEQVEALAPAKPLWRRIVDYPLVTMVLAAALYILAAGIGVAAGASLHSVHSRLLRTIISNALVLGFVLLTYKLVIVRMGEHPRDDLPARGAARNLGLGLLAGFVIFSAVVGVAAILGVYRIVGLGDASTFVLELVVTAIMPGFMEELLFRGIILHWLEEWGGSWVALVLSSLAFGFAHYFNPNSSVVACLWIAVEAGILLGGVYLLTRNLWMSVGLHAAWNFTQGEIFDIPVSGMDEHGLVQAKLSGPELLSGGDFGLEASVIALIIATAAGIWFVVLAARRGELIKPRWVQRRRLAQAAA